MQARKYFVKSKMPGIEFPDGLQGLAGLFFFP